MADNDPHQKDFESWIEGLSGQDLSSNVPVSYADGKRLRETILDDRDHQGLVSHEQVNELRKRIVDKPYQQGVWYQRAVAAGIVFCAGILTVYLIDSNESIYGPGNNDPGYREPRVEPRLNSSPKTGAAQTIQQHAFSVRTPSVGQSAENYAAILSGKMLMEGASVNWQSAGNGNHLLILVVTPAQINENLANVFQSIGVEAAPSTEYILEITDSESEL